MGFARAAGCSGRGLIPLSRLHRGAGLALTGAVARVSIQMAKIGWLQANGISTLTLAIVLGMVVGNTVYPGIGDGRVRE
jgi:uncharacterized membrane protein YadS